MKRILILMVLLLCLTLITASPHKQYTNYELVVSSNNATSCNYTYVLFPDNSKEITNFAMTKNGQDFNITIPSSNFSRTGDTCFGVSCFDGSDYETGSVCTEVTPSGNSGTLGFYFLILILSAGVIIFGFGIKDGWIVVLGSFGLILIGLLILFFGIDGWKDPTYTWGLGIIILMVGCYLSVRATIEQLDL